MKDSRKQLRYKLIVLTLIAVLGIDLLVYLFSASGPFIHYWKLDLNFLLAPSLLLLVIMILSSVVPLFFDPRYSPLSSTIIRYSALTFFTYLVLHRAVLFSRIPFLAHQVDFLSSLSTASIFGAFFWTGLGVYQISSLLTPFKKSNHGLQPLFEMLGFLIVGFSFWKSFDIFGVHWLALSGLGFVIGLSLILVSLTRLTAYITGSLTFLIGNALKWGLDHPVKLFWLSILVMSYFVFARPMLYSISPYAYLIEWILVCYTGYQILSKIKNNLKVYHTPVRPENDWKKHQQIIHKLADEDFNKMLILQEEFVQSGTRRNLLLFLRQILVNNGLSESQILRSLQPVIEYAEARSGWFRRWFFKKRVSQGNRYRRSQVVDDSMQRIREIVYSPRKNINGATNE